MWVVKMVGPFRARGQDQLLCEFSDEEIRSSAMPGADSLDAGAQREIAERLAMQKARASGHDDLTVKWAQHQDEEALRSDVRSHIGKKSAKWIKAHIWPAPNYARNEWCGGVGQPTWYGQSVERICKEEAERAIADAKDFVPGPCRHEGHDAEKCDATRLEDL